jgi:hypothetical protein
MIVVRGDEGLYDREFPHILGLDCAGVPSDVGDGRLAVRTALWMMMSHLSDMVGIGDGTFVPLMPRLSTFASSAWNAGRARWGRRRIGGGWFRRVLRMLVEPDMEIGDLCLELSELLLLLGHQCQQRHKGLLDEGRCGGPVIGRDTVW